MDDTCDTSCMYQIFVKQSSFKSTREETRFGTHLDVSYKVKCVSDNFYMKHSLWYINDKYICIYIFVIFIYF
jgi:hypothetical protein